MELYPGLVVGELPLRFRMVFVSMRLPGSDFLDEAVFVFDAPVEALRRQNTEFRLRHVEPTAVFGRVMPLEPLGETACFCRGEGGIQ